MGDSEKYVVRNLNTTIYNLHTWLRELYPYVTQESAEEVAKWKQKFLAVFEEWED